MTFKTLAYNQSLALVTDLYELTMAYSFLKNNLQNKEAVFNLFFRQNPFKSGFTIACGLTYVIDYLQNFKFDVSDLDYLSSIRGEDKKPLFDKAFLEYLRNINFECDIDAIPEATVVFPHEPLVRVCGPIIQAQILESVLLNIINFQSLIATKAARVVLAAGGEQVLEFGLRRAHGFDGALAASRAAYIGGCSSTSNLLAGKLFGIPVKGTHAHSWVMSFDDEFEAFKKYALAMPNNCVFLVDTYDTLAGVERAIEVGRWLKSTGHKMLGIRLDSGDLAYLSKVARKMLDEAGFSDSIIIASNDLDEHIISSLKEQGAKIGMWGVGTRLTTGYDQPALGGVYKLAAIRDPQGKWKYKVKLSEQRIKVSNPGILQVRRYFNEKENLEDVIYDISTDISKGCTMIDPLDVTRQKKIKQSENHCDLLVPVFRKGELVYIQPKIDEIRKTTQKNLEMFHSGIKRFVHPHQYPVGIEKSLFSLKTDLILQTREGVQEVGDRS